MKREVNKGFDEEKDFGKQIHELVDFLSEAMWKLQNRTNEKFKEALTDKQEQISEGMGKLKNKTKQLGNEIKNTRDIFKEEYKRVNDDMAKLQKY